MALTPDQLKKEIRLEVATLLNHDSPPEDGSEGEGDLRTIIENVVDAAIKEAVANMSDKIDKKVDSVLKISTELLSQLHQLYPLGGTPILPPPAGRSRTSIPAAPQATTGSGARMASVYRCTAI